MPIDAPPLPSARTSPGRRLLVAAVAVAALSGPVAVADAVVPGGDGVLAFQGARSAQGMLYLRNANGRDVQRAQGNASLSKPAFSPQGRRLAFAALGRVWVTNADGFGAPRALTTGPEPSGSPTWSPHGDAIAFARGAGAARQVFVIGADGNGLRALTRGPGDAHSPAWSSTNRIAFVRRLAPAAGGRPRRADDDLYVMGSNGASPRRLTSSRLDDDAPAWSPDGRTIAFVRRAGARRDLYVINVADGRLRRMTSRGDVSAPAWSPSGRWIVFSAGRSPRRALFVIRAHGGRPRRLTPLADDARAPDWQPAGGDPIIAAAGDIACSPSSPSFNDGAGLARQCHQRLTSDLLLRTDLSAVLPLGDLQYDGGELEGFLHAFDPTWGRLKDLMRPVLGNHEYRVPGATGYFDYFNGPGKATGAAGDRTRGYYSYDVGAWHIVALNSECSEPSGHPTATDCAAGSAQEQWLRADLAAHPAACTLAYWHHPLVSSGMPTVNEAMRPIWQALYDGGADVVLNGHDHAYERFAQQSPALAPDPVHGIREFVVGTGGKTLQGTASTPANSEVRSDGNFGVLQLRLHATSYDWAFIPDTPGGFTDTGTSSCH